MVIELVIVLASVAVVVDIVVNGCSQMKPLFKGAYKTRQRAGCACGKLVAEVAVAATKTAAVVVVVVVQFIATGYKRSPFKGYYYYYIHYNHPHQYYCHYSS